MAPFNVNVKKMFDLLMNLTTSDRERWWWLLHVSCMQIFPDNFSGVRRSQLLRLVLRGETQVLDAEYLRLYRRFTISTCVVRDLMGSFNCVELDMKLEQFIQRAPKNQGGIIGQTRTLPVMVEWEQIFHEVLLIQNNCRKLTNERMIKHHMTIMYKELRGNKGLTF